MKGKIYVQGDNFTVYTPHYCSTNLKIDLKIYKNCSDFVKKKLTDFINKYFETLVKLKVVLTEDVRDNVKFIVIRTIDLHPEFKLINDLRSLNHEVILSQNENDLELFKNHHSSPFNYIYVNHHNNDTILKWKESQFKRPFNSKEFKRLIQSNIKLVKSLTTSSFSNRLENEVLKISETGFISPNEGNPVFSHKKVFDLPPAEYLSNFNVIYE